MSADDARLLTDVLGDLRAFERADLATTSAGLTASAANLVRAGFPVQGEIVLHLARMLYVLAHEDEDPPDPHADTDPPPTGNLGRLR